MDDQDGSVREQVLLDAADAYRRHLPSGQFMLTEIGGLDRMSLPIVVANLAGDAGWVNNGFGYGFTTAECLVGALGELSELVHGRMFMARIPRVEGSYARLTRELGPRAVVDPLTLCLPAGSDYDPQRPMLWIEGRRWPSGEPVLLPEEFVGSNMTEIRGDRPLITPISNGLGAGPSPQFALCHALLEILQRDGNGLVFRAMDRGVAIEFDEDPGIEITGLLNRFAEHKVEVIPKFATTEFGIANLYVVSADADPDADLPLKQTACGEAAHPDRSRALRKAMLECAAARVRKAFQHGPLEPIARVAGQEYIDRYLERLDLESQETRSLNAMVEWLGWDGSKLRQLLAGSVMARRSTVPYSALPTAETPDRETTLEIVTERLSAAGLEVIVVDTSPSGGGVSTCKAVVPGLEVETMSYRRIGERGIRKLLERGSPIVGLGKPPEGTLPIRLTPDAIDRLGDQAWLDPNAIDSIIGPLYPLYREPISHAAQAARARRFGVTTGTS